MTVLLLDRARGSDADWNGGAVSSNTSLELKIALMASVSLSGRLVVFATG
jgi:hypothetical protein